MMERPPSRGRGPEARKEIRLTPEQLQQFFHDLLLAKRLVSGTEQSVRGVAWRALESNPNLAKDTVDTFKLIGSKAHAFDLTVEKLMRETMRMTEDEWFSYAGSLLVDDLSPKIDPNRP